MTSARTCGLARDADILLVSTIVLPPAVTAAVSHVDLFAAAPKGLQPDRTGPGTKLVAQHLGHGPTEGTSTENNSEHHSEPTLRLQVIQILRIKIMECPTFRNNEYG